jgi:tRNA nucleotidyltransferase (CCA-adding enzyme)
MEDIFPTKKEEQHLKSIVDNFSKKLKDKEVNFLVGGSYAKGTWLKGKPDIDIFARFNYEKYNDKDISKELKKLLRKKKINSETIHGSRDYFQTKIEGFVFEIIPVLDIKKSNKSKNVTDVSPLHVRYIKKHATEKIKNDIRLLKKLCKSHDLYGAESYIKGFSGYVLEVLTVHYGSLKKLINAVKKWDEKEIIDPARHYDSKKDVLSELNRSKKESPLILIDPVQKERNLAAALSNRKYGELIKLANTYDGSKEFFVKKEVNPDKLKGYTVFKIKPLDKKIDIAGAKLLKALEKTKKAAEREGLKVKDYGWKWEDEHAYFWFKTNKLEKIKKHYGPQTKQKSNLENFKKKWKGKRIYKEKGKVYIKIKRTKTTSKDVLQEILKNQDIKNNFLYQKLYKQSKN